MSVVTSIECLPVEVFPDGGAKVVEDGVEGVGVGWVENADNPLTVVQESAVGGGHPALPRE